MIDLWLSAIESLILTAPGNADEEAGLLWDSTLERLGETDADEARVRRFHWDFLEADDVAAERPFFVLNEIDVNWTEYNYDDLAAAGVIEIAYTELALQDVTHKVAKQDFLRWTGCLIEWLAMNAKQGQVPIATIRQSVFPQRTARKNRDPDKPETDYFWAAWEIVIGDRARADWRAM